MNDFGIVIDIETTGLPEYNIENGVRTNADHCEILSFGYIRTEMSTNRIFDAGILYFYKPYFNIESEAQKVHHLTRDFLKQYEQDFDKNLAKMEMLITNSALIGKNSDSFDIPFITAFLRKHSGFPDIVPTFINSDKNVMFAENVCFDTQQLFAPYYRKIMAQRGVELSPRKRGRLEEYIEALCVQATVDSLYAEISDTVGSSPVATYHDALYDACSTYIVYEVLRKIYGERTYYIK